MIKLTNNKIIYLNVESVLECDSSILFDAMQEVAGESTASENFDQELQKSYMKLLSDNARNK